MSEYKPGDKFEIVKSVYMGEDLQPGCIVEFVSYGALSNKLVKCKPIGDEYPDGLFFAFEGEAQTIGTVRPLKTEAEKRGAKFGVGGVVKATGKKWIFAAQIAGIWRGIAEDGCVFAGEPYQFRLDHEPDFKEIPFSEATHEQRMDVRNLKFNGSSVDQIFMFDNGKYAFTSLGIGYVCISTSALTVRVPT